MCEPARLLACAPARLSARLPACSFYCAGSLDTGEEYPSCRPVPPACGQLGSKCCPPEERPADLPGANSGTGAFCYAADVVCSAPMGSVEASGGAGCMGACWAAGASSPAQQEAQL